MKSNNVAEDSINTADLELIQAVLPYAREKRCAVGEGLITTGEYADCFYYVESGTFEVSYTAQQTAIVVALIGAGAFFGEIGFFDRLARTRNIQAVEDARLRLFDRSIMNRLHEERPQLYGRFLEFILREVCGRFRQILTDRGPLSAYAASLTTGREQFRGLQALPADLLGSSGWREINRELEEFKANMFDVAYRLQQEAGPEISPELHHRGAIVLDEFLFKVREFGAFIETTESADLMWGYVFKEVFPYLMRSRFAERAYYKPKGYAGDFFMIELIYRQQPDGDGKLGKLIDHWALQQIPPRAVRGRRSLLRNLLDQLCRERLNQSEPIRIMNLACGPSRELFDLVAECDYSEKINALCIDIDPEALQYANQEVNRSDHKASVRFMNENVIKWAIGRVKHDFGPQDIIYSSGLCDYLDDRLTLALIKRCFDHLNPGGALIIGNFSRSNPDRLFMDHLLYWRLIYRDNRDLQTLFDRSPFGKNLEIIAEEEGVNLFAVARRTA